MKSLIESILDDDKTIIKNTEFTKIIDKTVDILYKYLKGYNKQVISSDTFGEVYKFKINKNYKFVQDLVQSIDKEMLIIRTRYHLTYDKTELSFISNYSYKELNLCMLVNAYVSHSHLGDEDVISHILVSAYSGLYQGQEYKTDSELGRVFNERMKKKFGFRS